MIVAGLEVYQRIRNDWVGKTKYIYENPNDPEIDPKKGFGCWGFVWYFSKEYGLELPKEAWRAYGDFDDIEGLPHFLDVVCFPYDGNAGRSRVHIGSMLDDRLMVHCSKPGDGVTIDDVTIPPWQIPFKRKRYRIIRHKLLA